MIIRPRPGLFSLLFTLRGSIVPLIAPRVALVVVVSIGVVAAHHLRPGAIPELPAASIGLLGLSLSIFLGFRNNACYDRWWEARRQWGQLVTEARNLSRRLEAMRPVMPHDRATRHIVGFAHALAARLRGIDAAAAAQPWVSVADAQALAPRTNVPDAILRLLTSDLAACHHRGEISDVDFNGLETHVAAMCGIQTACERIRSTPTPFAYTLLLHRTAWLFCLLVPFTLVGAAGFAAPLVAAILAYAFFGLDALGDELEEPFALRSNTLPMNALVRIIEIELLESLGETDLPPPLQPIDDILT